MQRLIVYVTIQWFYVMLPFYLGVTCHLESRVILSHVSSCPGTWFDDVLRLVICESRGLHSSDYSLVFRRPDLTNFRYVSSSVLD